MQFISIQIEIIFLNYSPSFVFVANALTNSPFIYLFVIIILFLFLNLDFDNIEEELEHSNYMQDSTFKFVSGYSGVS